MLKKLVFIRDDDVYKIDAGFLALFEPCLKLGIPVIYGVIPRKITPDLVTLFNQTKKKHPRLIDIAQHGWRHKDYSKNITDKYEFGACRDYLQQKQDIQKGLERMIKLFGKNFTFAFTPPYHAYDCVTLSVISELGFAVFSADSNTAIKDKAFLDLAAGLSLNDYNAAGEPRYINSSELIKRAIRYLNCSDANPTGMVLHHRALKNKKMRKDFYRFLLFLKKLQARKIIKLILFSDICSGRYPGRGENL